MPAEPDATRARPGDDGLRPDDRLTLSRREVLGGASAAALMVVLVGCDPPAGFLTGAPERGEPWDDGTFWDDGTGWV